MDFQQEGEEDLPAACFYKTEPTPHAVCNLIFLPLQPYNDIVRGS
jgi:hypothetical protein